MIEYTNYRKFDSTVELKSGAQKTSSVKIEKTNESLRKNDFTYKVTIIPIVMHTNQNMKVF